jgi:Na+-driven multidrug efflux pump
MRNSDTLTAVAGDALEAGPARESLWTLVRQALRGQRQDYTALPLRRAVFLLAVPMVLEMLMESVFAVVDIFWVSKLGADAVAAVTLTESMIVLVYAVAIGLSMGVGAVVARRTGEKDRDGAARAAV